MVEWKKLEDICIRITDGSHFSPQAVEQGYYMPSVKDMTASGFDFSFCKQISETDYLNLVKNGCRPQKGDVLVAKDGSMLKYVFPINKEEDIVVLSSIALLSPKQEILNSAYLSYYLLRSDIKEKTIREFSSKGGVPRIILNNFKKIQVPIPSLEEQNRIVGILDTFTDSIENLKQQIAQRRKQYEHYREKLLDLEGKEGVEMMKLGDVCIIKNGYTPSTKNLDFWENGTLPWFTLEDIRKNGRILADSIKHITPLGVKKGGLFSKNSIIISTTATIGEYALIQEDFLCNQQITCLSIKNSNFITSKFLYYLADMIGRWCKKNVNGGGSLLIVSSSKLNNLSIPVPSLQEQQRIVSILDTFEASISNLEAQLEQRQKQYEYYRNKLLSFEEEQ